MGVLVASLLQASQIPGSGPLLQKEQEEFVSSSVKMNTPSLPSSALLFNASTAPATSSSPCNPGDVFNMLGTHLPFVMFFGGLFYTVGAVTGVMMRNWCAHMFPCATGSRRASVVQVTTTPLSSAQHHPTTYTPPQSPPRSLPASADGGGGGSVAVDIEAAAPADDDARGGDGVNYRHCVVCLDQVSSVVLIPCGHVCVCRDELCRNTASRTCPVCRKDVQLSANVFLS